MGKIIVSENVSIDGVFQDPTGEEGVGRGHWFTRIGDGDREKWAGALLDEARGAAALLLGRRSYEYFATRYPSRTDELAATFNTLPKYVVSGTLHDPDWPDSTVLAGDVVEEVSRLTRRVDGDVVVYASSRLVRTLVEHDLVDEMRLTVFPFVLGAGDRLFDRTDAVAPLRLVAARTVGDGLAFLTYQRIRDVENPAGGPHPAGPATGTTA